LFLIQRTVLFVAVRVMKVFTKPTGEHLTNDHSSHRGSHSLKVMWNSSSVDALWLHIKSFVLWQSVVIWVLSMTGTCSAVVVLHSHTPC